MNHNKTTNKLPLIILTIALAVIGILCVVFAIVDSYAKFYEEFEVGSVDFSKTYPTTGDYSTPTTDEAYDLPKAHSLAGLTVDGALTKTDYMIGEKVTLDGVTVTASCSLCDDTWDVTDKCQLSVDYIVDDTRSFTASYTHNGVTRSTRFDITTNESYRVEAERQISWYYVNHEGLGAGLENGTYPDRCFVNKDTAGGQQIDDENVGACGDGYVGYYDSVGERLDFFVVATKAQTVTLRLRASSAKSIEDTDDYTPIAMKTIDLPQAYTLQYRYGDVLDEYKDLTIDDTAVLTGESTDDTVNGDSTLWTRWQTVDLCQFELREGVNIITLTVAAADSGINVDYLEFVAN